MNGGKSKFTPAQKGPPGGASYIERRAGVRELKEYPITAEELDNLALVQHSSTALLALAGACFGFWLNGQQTISLSDGARPEDIAFWQAIHTVAISAAVVLSALGTWAFWISGTKVRKIKISTRHT